MSQGVPWTDEGRDGVCWVDESRTRVTALMPGWPCGRGPHGIPDEGMLTTRATTALATQRGAGCEEG